MSGPWPGTGRVRRRKTGHMPLSIKRIARLTKPGRYGDGGGLLLKVTPGGAQTWIFRYQRGDRERWMGLGPLHTVSLPEARERARAARLQLLDGLDPLEARNAARARTAAESAARITFAEATERYLAQHE